MAGIGASGQASSEDSVMWRRWQSSQRASARASSMPPWRSMASASARRSATAMALSAGVLTTTCSDPECMGAGADDEWSSADSGISGHSGLDLALGGERELIDQRLDGTLHHLGQVVEGGADAVIGDAILGEIVGPDLLGAL